jgi:uncharacterized membrane protein YgcG
VIRGAKGAFAALLLFFALTAPGFAEERILSFESDVAIQEDGALDVTETITVRAEGDRIRRGILRDFPTRYEGRHGGQVRVGFDLIGVTRNGEPETAVREAIRNGVRIRIGKEDLFLDPGDHRYVIRYRTDRQLGRFDGFDELYWNVTGTGWIFPIDRVDARITLPRPARFGQHSVYTGPQGATGKQARVVEEKPGQIHFQTTGPLGPYEGLTVAVAFPKGIVADASASARQRWWLTDYGPIAAGVLGLLGTIAFYWIAWKRAGRDPVAGTVVPLFSPPDDLTPAAMRYVWKMKADNRAFAAALVDLGVKGHVRLVEEDGGWFSSDTTRIERQSSGTPLPAAEEAMLRELAMTGESIEMKQENHAKFRTARNALDEDFKSRFEGKMFHRNWGWAVGGALLVLAALWLTAAAIAAATGAAEPATIVVGVGALLTAALLCLLVQYSGAVGKCLLVVGIFLFGALAMGVGFPIVEAALSSGWILPILIPLVAVPLVASAFWWMSAPTREGRKLLDRIAGFRQYLSIAQGERLDRMTAPDDTPEIFEKYLPYAIALGVENEWADRFRGVLAAASAQSGQQGFSWYSGSHSPWDDASGFVSDVGSSLASSVSSASTAPGSSSGSGGGGSSGGGGGGGGGGGW